MDFKTLMNKKTNTTAIILAVLLTSVMLFAMAAPAQAQDQPHGGAPQLTPWATSVPAGTTASFTTATSSFMSVNPNPIGVGQPLLVNLWLEPPLQFQRFFSGYTVTITKPDGTTTTVGPVNSYQGDATAWFNYVPETVGQYKFAFSFAGNFFPAGYYFNGRVYPSIAAIGPYTAGMFIAPTYLDSAFYQASQSPTTTITVQSDMVASWPAIPLPTDYWWRPIPIGSREWWSIGGQYPFLGLGGGQDWPAGTNTYASNYKYTPYVEGPETSHVVWLREGALAGIMGGQYGINSVGPGESPYAGTPTIVFQGRAYQTVTKPFATVVNGTDVTETVSVWQCYDIRTGKIYWEQTGITQAPTIVTQNLVAGSVPGAEQTGMGAGSFSLVSICSSRIIRYDPYTGSVQLNITLPFSSGTMYVDPYVLSIQDLGAAAANATGGRYRLINWTVAGGQMGTAVSGITVLNNISYPFSSLGTTDYESMITVYTGSITPSGAGTAQGQFIYAASLTSGTMLWNVTTKDIFFSTSTGCADHGKYAVRVLGGWWDCWDLRTGNIAWQTAKAGETGGESYPWGDFGPYTTASYGGLLYDFSYAGFYAIDWSNGKIAWHYVPQATPFEAPWYPSMSLFSNSPIIADGKLYYSNGEHSPSEPLSRGWTLWCLNATTGDVIWSKLDGGSPGAIADGYLTFDDRYDGYMYVFGKGQSATTVSAPQEGVTVGQSVVISGTILDQSPGIVPASTTQAGSTVQKNMRGVQNVACVSKDSMSAYMQYIYGQQPIDGMYHNLTITGVPISIDAIDENNAVTHVATVTSDGASGTFGYSWTPSTKGLYKITASFAGDDSYGTSWALTYATVVAATEVVTPPTQPVTFPPYEMYIIGVGIAVILAVAVVGILVLRKKA